MAETSCLWRLIVKYVVVRAGVLTDFVCHTIKIGRCRYVPLQFDLDHRNVIL